MKRFRHSSHLSVVAIALTVLVDGCAHKPSESSGDDAGNSASTPGTDRMAAFRAKFPGTAALVTTVSGLHQMLNAGQDPMTPTQAQAALSLVAPLQYEASLKQADALTLSKNLNATLTPQQQTDIGSLREERRNSSHHGGAGGKSRGGSHGAPSLDVNMAPDNNVFADGRLYDVLEETIAMLQTAKSQ